MGVEELRKVVAGIAVTSLLAGTALTCGGCAGRNGGGGEDVRKERTESQPAKSG